MILVVGDVIVDKYVHCKMERISREAPVPILDVIRTTVRPGGAANVAENIRSLGEEVMLVSVGDRHNVPPELRSYRWVTSSRVNVRTRYVVDDIHVLKIDESCKDITNDQRQSVLDELIYCISTDPPKVLVMSDYDHGIFEEEFSRKLIEFSNEHRVPVIVDPRKDDWDQFRHATVLTPNLADYGRKFDGYPNPMILLTMGGKGMSLFHYDNPCDNVIDIPAHPVKCVDPTGAGDTVVAALAVGMSRGMSLEMAARFSNKCASIAVQHRGTYAVKESDLD